MALSYASQGHMLAAANLNIVNLYDSTSYEIIMTLNGHANNTFVRDIQWKNNDLGLLTSCNGGSLNYWDSSDGVRKVEFYYKIKKTNALFYD